MCWAAECVAQDMTLGRLLALSLLGLPGMQIEHVVAGVIVGMVERDVTDPDFHSLHGAGAFRLPTR